MKRPHTMTCSCCGSGAFGRQWWNRDTGYGLCAWCVPFMLDHRSTMPDIFRSHGKPGHNFAMLLTSESPIGSLVAWEQLDGQRFAGTLKEFDNGTAIVVANGKEHAVRV